MNTRSRDAALARMERHHAELLELCAKAYGVGDYAGQDPDPEAAAELESVLEAQISNEEQADLELVGWSPKWKKNLAGFVCMMLDMAEDDVFEVSVGPGLAPVDPNATEPQTRL